MTNRFRFAASIVALACAVGFGLSHLPARAQSSGEVVTKPGTSVLYAPTLGAPSVATADGRGHVVVAYSGGLIAVVTPGATESISTYRINADGTVDVKSPFTPRSKVVPLAPGQGGGFGGGGGGFGGSGKGF